MKFLSTLANSVKLQVGLAFVAGLAACGPMVERAPFAVRPDTIERGDLLGPFDGLVVDGETGRGVSGAVVEASWAFERGSGFVDPFGSQHVTVETEADGRYTVPRLGQLPQGSSARVRRFTLLVYKRGFVGWRSDGAFPSGARRTDFAQRSNRVRLDRWRDDLAHHRHLVFLGGGPAVQDAAAWEAQLAVAELEGRSPVAASEGSAQTAAAKGLLDVSAVLSEDDVRGVTGFSGAFDVTRLADLPRTEFYDTRHFKARGKPEAFDVAVRLWRLGETGADDQFRKIVAELPGATPTREIGDRAVEANAANVRALVFLVRDGGTVVSVTCGSSQCTEAAQVLKLGKLVEGHLQDLDESRAPAAAPKGAPAVTPPTGGTP